MDAVREPEVQRQAQEGLHSLTQGAHGWDYTTRHAPGRPAGVGAPQSAKPPPARVPGGQNETSWVRFTRRWFFFWVRSTQLLVQLHKARRVRTALAAVSGECGGRSVGTHAFSRAWGSWAPRRSRGGGGQGDIFRSATTRRPPRPAARSALSGHASVACRARRRRRATQRQ